MAKYLVIKSKVEVGSVGYDIYGITGNGITIPNISTSKGIAEHFVNEINKAGDVEPIHIPDIAHNFKIDFKF